MASPVPSAGPAWEDWKPSHHSMAPPHPSPDLLRNCRRSKGRANAGGSSRRAQMLLPLKPAVHGAAHGEHTGRARQYQRNIVILDLGGGQPESWFLSHGAVVSQIRSIRPAIPHFPPSAKPFLRPPRPLSPSRLNTSSPDGSLYRRTLSSSWHSGLISTASPSSVPFVPAAPFTLRHHTSFSAKNNASSVSPSSAPLVPDEGGG